MNKNLLAENDYKLITYILLIIILIKMTENFYIRKSII